MTDAILYCENHPNRETSLRCNRCGKPICVSCAVQTPVGYRCRECVRGQQDVFETASNLQLGLAFGISAIGAAIAIAIIGSFGIFFGIILSPIAGGGLAEIVRWAMRGGRSRNLPIAAAAGAAAGILLYAVISLAPVFLLFSSLPEGVGIAQFLGGVAFQFLPLVYGALMIGTLFYRLRGIRI